MPFVDPTCYNGAVKTAISHCAFTGTVEFIILLDKVLEFAVLRRLMIILDSLKLAPIAHLDITRRRPVQSPPSNSRRTTASYDPNHPDKIVGEIKDSDDDVNVFNEFLQLTNVYI